MTRCLNILSYPGMPFDEFARLAGIDSPPKNEAQKKIWALVESGKLTVTSSNNNGAITSYYAAIEKREDRGLCSKCNAALPSRVKGSKK
jgi:hypothetical protein